MPTRSLLPSAARRPASLLGAALAAVLALGGCADGAFLVTGPSGLTATTGGGAGGAPIAQSPASLLGRWTRLDGGGAGTLTEVTFTFASDGSGARTTVVRTALGAVVAADQAPFAWTAGAGVLVLRFPQPVGVDAVLTARYAVEVTVNGTTLRLDGVPYLRTNA